MATMPTPATNGLDPSYILHSRKYRDTSVILELFGLDAGRHAVVVKGARGARSRVKGHLQPFTPLLVGSVGRTELKTSTSIDIRRRAYRLSGEPLMLGLYANELLYRLMGRFDPAPVLYNAYEALLESLQKDDSLISVRQFELRLLQELGYGVDFVSEVTTGQPIEPQGHYRYVGGEGFCSLARPESEGDISGTQIHHIRDGNWVSVDETLLRTITRRALWTLLEGRPLHSSALFRGRTR